MRYNKESSSEAERGSAVPVRNSAKALVLHEDRILLNRCASHYGEYYALPGGGQRPGELLTEAVCRELLEETGFGGGQWSELMVVSANPSTQTNLTHCFVATDVERISEQHLESTEDLTVHLLTPEQVRDLLLGDRIKQALHAAPLWRYFAENRLL